MWAVQQTNTSLLLQTEKELYKLMKDEMALLESSS